MEFFAHSAPEAEPDTQLRHPLAIHLQDTGKLAARFLKAVNGNELGRAAGLLHDLGKYSTEFQARLAGSPQRVDHATAGARVALEKYGPRIGKILAFCIAGHHTGLSDGRGGGEGRTSLEYRLGDDYVIPEIDAVWEQEIALPGSSDFSTLTLCPTRCEEAFGVAFFTRMLFSALVDADRTDTRAWFSGEKSKLKAPSRSPSPSIRELQRRLGQHLLQLAGNAQQTKINGLRRQVLQHVRSQAEQAPGLFSLTVPTGGGKTLASLAFALDHAVRHGLKRVIYVIPYISIVDQTARTFRRALSDEDGSIVLEHHSAFDEERISGREGQQALRLAMETWDRPIVVTTAVQFYESLFSDRPSRCRKLHNLAESVVILDEAQTLPLALLQPCVAAIRELARNWKASVVLCTATQPALHALKPAAGFAGGLEDVRELAPDPQALYTSIAAQRTRIVKEHEPIDDVELASHLLGVRQVLCIVNTRRHGRELYERIRAEEAEGVFHLTTALCARHREQKLRHIIERLKDDEPVRLVATSLIEAGVDIDFPMVWRAETGLQSIIQAAGRCNREGRRELGTVHVFKSVEAEGRRPPPAIAQFAAIARSVMRQHADPLSLEAIEAYFRETYWVTEDRLDREGILAEIWKRKTSFDFPFQKIARDFRMIDTAMEPVIIPSCPAGAGHRTWKIPEGLLDQPRAGALGRQLQRYVVQIPPKARANLLASGAARLVREQEFGLQFVVLLENSDLYNAETGLDWDDPFYRAAESLVV